MPSEPAPTSGGEIATTDRASRAEAREKRTPAADPDGEGGEIAGLSQSVAVVTLRMRTSREGLECALSP
jgi:hypothetical protein